MPLTLPEALAHRRSAEAARFANWSREVARSRGVCVSGMGPGPYEPTSDAELLKLARADARRIAEKAATPQGRFLACVTAIRRQAEATGNEALHAAAERAVACANRGIEGEADHAGKLLAEIELLGGDVRAAADALAEVSGQQEAA